MKICIDISQIIYKGSGVARFTEGLVKAICSFDRENEWHFFISTLRGSLSSPIEDMIVHRKNAHLHRLFIPQQILAAMWNTAHIVPIETFCGPVDWVITSDWTEPPSQMKKATIIHDLTYLRYPETVDPLIRNTQEERMKWVKKESDIIFADSNATQQDIVSLLKIDKKKVVTNYPGTDTSSVVSRKPSSRKPFILTVSKLEPRKNMERFIEAFSKLGRNDIDLYIVGMSGWGKDLSSLISRIGKNNIKLLGYVPDEKLEKLYTECLCFVYPSIWEGFGYPVLEAMSHGAAVATSNTSSLKEIADSAALFFDPFKVIDIKNAMQKLIDNSTLKDELSKKGLKRSREFTWKRYYNKLIEVLKENS